jgi:hypothetical protein
MELKDREAAGASPWRSEDSTPGGPVEGSPQPAGDLREALGEVDPEPGAGLHEVVPKAPVDVVASGLAANCIDEQYAKLLEQMTPITEQVAEKLNLQ